VPDRSTGRIYISRDVVFDEKVFAFSTPGVVVDVSKLIPVSFPSTEPVTQSTDTRSYDITLLPVNASGFVGSPVQVPSSASEQRPIDVQPTPPLHASGRVPDPTLHAATMPAPPLPTRGAAPGAPLGARSPLPRRQPACPLPASSPGHWWKKCLQSRSVNPISPGCSNQD
jgi:hypothetical protein